jgi:hypothetical protein
MYLSEPAAIASSMTLASSVALAHILPHWAASVHTL